MPFDIWSDLALTALCGAALITWIGRDLESAKPDVRAAGHAPRGGTRRVALRPFSRHARQERAIRGRSYKRPSWRNLAGLTGVGGERRERTPPVRAGLVGDQVVLHR